MLACLQVEQFILVRVCGNQRQSALDATSDHRGTAYTPLCLVCARECYNAACG